MHYRVKPYNCKKRPHLKAVVRWKNANGEWERRYFRNAGAGKTWAQQEETRLLNEGRDALTFSTALRVQAQECQERLSEFGKTLRDATNFYCENLIRNRASCTVGSAFERYFASKAGRGVTRNYLNHLRSLIGRQFVSAFPPEKLTSEITSADCEGWIHNASSSSNPYSINARHKHLSTFFNWCQKQKLCSENPTSGIEFLPEPDTEVDVLSPNQVRALLELADPQLLAYVSIGAFAGIRKEEIHRLEWSDVVLRDDDDDESFIRVPGPKSKNKDRREVVMQPCLKAWLRPIAKESGPVVNIGDLWRRFRDLRLRAGIQTWPTNALRHSFASYFLKHFKNRGELMEYMGHLTPGMLNKHYRRLVTAADAAAYWSIFPKYPDNVLSIALSNTPTPSVCINRSRDPISGKYGPLPEHAHYSKSAAEYAEIYGVTQQCICKWIRLGKPLDRPEEMDALRAGSYASTAEEYAIIYKAPVTRVKLWMKHGWPLDNYEGVKSFLARRQAVEQVRPRSRPKVISLVREGDAHKSDARNVVAIGS
jgi:integrase